MKLKIKKLMVVAAAVGGLMFATESGFACTGCRVAGDVVEESEQKTVTAGVGLSWSVLFMLGTVTVLGGGMGVLIKRTIADVDRRNSSYL